MTKLSLNLQWNSVSLTSLHCSITVGRESDYRWEGLARPVSFLIASPTLIRTIYHSLEPGGSLWKFSRLWGWEYLLLLSAPHPLFKSTRPSTTHTRLTWLLSHTPMTISSSAYFDCFPFRLGKGMLKKRGKGWLSRVSIFTSPKGRWNSLLQPPPRCCPIYHMLHPISP